MGLFDRLRKAFGGHVDEEEHKEQNINSTAESTTASTAESAAAPASESVSASASNGEPLVKSDEEAPVAAPVNNSTVVPVEPEPAETPVAPAGNAEPIPVKPESTSQTASSTATDSTESASAESAVSAISDSASSVPEPESASEPEERAAEEETEPAPTEADTLAQYDEGLAKSRSSFGARLNRFLARFRSVDDAFFDDLEETLIEADVGFETAMQITDQLRDEVKLRNVKKKNEVAKAIVAKMVDLYGEAGEGEDNALHFATDKTPTVFLFVGVNGAGKTTTIGKLAHRFQEQGKQVILAAGDTFRAGATEQLVEWGKRVHVPVVTGPKESDPAAVVYDAVHHAKEQQADIVLVDTAGRLQNKVNLMNELAKIKRVITRELPEAPQEVLLVLDATTGQNALNQAKEFAKTTKVTGIVLTKLDGSAKGGIVLAIRNELHLPVKLVGLGEKMNDLADFDPNKFVYGLFKDLIVQ